MPTLTFIRRAGRQCSSEQLPGTPRRPIEPRSTFGIIGAMLVPAAPAIVAARRRLDFPAALFIGGVAAHVLLALRLG